MILHGIYDNGRIILIDKDLPRIKANVNISFSDEDKPKRRLKNTDKNNSIKELRGIWKSRKDIGDSSEWVQAQRRLIGKRLK